MSDILQVSMFLASLAVIALAACAIPLLLQARRQMNAIARAAERWQADLGALMQEGRELVRNANALTLRAGREMDELDRVVRLAREWAERGNQLMDAVGALVAPPVSSVLQGVAAFRTGAGIFVNYLFGDRNHRSKEENHG